MWSSASGVYPVHLSSPLAPQGQRLLVEPSVHKVNADYLVVQSSREPYGIPQEYTKRLWIC